MKKHDLKYRASGRIEALKKMSLPVVHALWQTGAMILFWVCKMVCKDTPVLIAWNRTVQAAKFGEGPQATFERDARGH